MRAFGGGPGATSGPGAPATDGVSARVGLPRRRQTVLLVLALALSVVFAGRLVQVQVLDGPGLAAAAQEGRQRSYTVHAARGEIVDSSGAVLATSVVRYDVVIDQRQVGAYKVYDADGKTIVGRGQAAAAERLAPLLGVSAHELGAQLTGTSGYTVIAKGVTPEVRSQIIDLGINGLTTEQKAARVYPAGTTAGSIVGWVNAEGLGAAGLESRFDGALAGLDGTREVEIGVGGTVIPAASQSTVPAQDGGTVHTTIDADLQALCQGVIEATVAERSAEWGAVVVEEVRTGRILALCESGMVDPNAPTGYGRINAVQSPYEPGSTGKILTVAAAVEEGLVTPTTAFEVPYLYTPPNSNQTFKDHTEHPTEVLTTTGILADSSNTGTIKIGQLMSDQTRADYMERFGWTETSGIELAGEGVGLGTNPETWDGRQRFTTMFGQGVAVNLLQNVNVIATLANGGLRMPLHIVDGVTSPDGTFTRAEGSEPVQVVSPETGAQVIRMLESVTATEGATGTRASVEGYRVAGKTGTAQIADQNGRLNDTAASFVGVVPAEDPAIAVGVVIYRPRTGFFGGTIAAPVFSEVASAALRSLGVPPSTEAPDLYPTAPPAG